MKNKESYTMKEIYQQPILWQKIYDMVEGNESSIAAFMKSIIDANSDVIFTGAGSSFFIGEMVSSIFQKDTGLSSRAISSTEIVTHPDEFINSNKPTLLVSFARSGNSPESLASVNIANKVSNKVKHLIITCNKEGALSELKNDKDSFVLVLPDEANDRSLAMTSSVTSMALVALLIGRLPSLKKQEIEIQNASKAIEYFFSKYSSAIKEIATVEYDRAVFLGSGSMVGVAREAHLKLQELTDGKIISKFDSFLGFRHGPKAIVNSKTLMVYMFSNNEYVRQYEYDLVSSIKNVHNPILSIGISNLHIIEEIGKELDMSINVIKDGVQLDDGIWTIASLVVAQLLATSKSIELGFNPDSPSKTGAIHRVVQGVTIYEH